MGNVIAFESAESVLEKEISTKYWTEKKKNVNIYDSSTSEVVKLTIWGNYLDLAREHGTCKFQGLRVISF